MDVLDANAVVKVGQRIGNCDFNVTVSRYVTGDSSPWMISVGESSWRRNLIVTNIVDDGEDAGLDLLATDRSKVERHITLKELVSDSYGGVKRVLVPKAQAA